MSDQASKDTSLQSTKQMLDELDALMERMLSLPVNDLEEAPASPREMNKNEPTLAASLTLLEPEAPPPQEVPAQPQASAVEPVVNTRLTDANSTDSTGVDTKLAADSLAAAKLAAAKLAAAKLASTKLASAKLASAKSAVAALAGAKRSTMTLPRVVLPAKKSFEQRDKTTQVPHPPLKPPHQPRLPAKLKELEPEESATIPAEPPQPELLTNEILPPTVLPSMETLLTQAPVTASPESVSAWRFNPLLGINRTFDRATLSLGSAGRWLRSQGGRSVLGFTGVALLVVAASWVLRDWMGWN